MRSTMAAGKRPILVIYGGRSAEHEVSCRSAAFVLEHLDPEKYAVHAVGVTKDGAWVPQDLARLQARPSGPVPILSAGRREAPTVVGEGTGPGARSLLASMLGAVNSLGANLDELVVFPVIHGTSGEDGTLQGLLELAEVAFVGPDTLGSAIGMDKVVSKQLAQAAGVPVVPWLDVRAHHWSANAAEITKAALRELGLPLFVKPARLGSSVGVTKVRRAEELSAACEAALAFDDRILIEKAVNVREIEVAALGGYEPEVSVPGEVVLHAEFYSYDAKYLDASASSVAIPADIPATTIQKAQALAKRVFQALNLYGMARIDLFLDRGTGEFYFNEVNTIPGFTQISQYPLLWQATGVPPRQLVDRLIDSAVARQRFKSTLRRSR